jgi:putative hemolysin
MEGKLSFVRVVLSIVTLISLSLAATAPARADNDASVANAATYCVKKGGEVQTRVPEYGTNGGNALVLSGSADFCKFTSRRDGSRIYTFLSTLQTDQPTLAALAYYAQVPPDGGCTGNPASCYCSQLGGTDLFGGINAAGGGWVLESDPVDTVVDACIFPDLSVIDSWGLTYHSVGIVRGINLSRVLRYKNPNAAGLTKNQKKNLPF